MSIREGPLPSLPPGHRILKYGTGMVAFFILFPLFGLNQRMMYYQVTIQAHSHSQCPTAPSISEVFVWEWIFHIFLRFDKQTNLSTHIFRRNTKKMEEKQREWVWVRTSIYMLSGEMISREKASHQAIHSNAEAFLRFMHCVSPKAKFCLSTRFVSWQWKVKQWKTSKCFGFHRKLQGAHVKFCVNW